MPDVVTTLVVVNFGGPDLLEENLLPLASRSAAPVVVVDNYSGDTNRADVEVFCKRNGWDLLTPAANLGFGTGANLGVERAFALGATVVCLLNPDATMAVESLQRLAAAADAEPTALVAPRIVNAQGRPWFTGAAVDVAGARTRKADLSSTETVIHPWLTGTCLVFHTDAWKLTGGFADDYFLYWEDVDLSWRHVAAGGRLLYLDDVTISHAVSATHRTDRHHGRSPLYYYYNCRNRMLFAARNLGPRDQRRWALRSAGYAREVLLRGGRRQFLRPWQPLSATVRGTLAGLRRLLRQRSAARR